MSDESICVGCGLCCDGTLFSHLTTLDETDLGMPLRMLGVEIIVEADPPVFALPCPAVAEGRCTIYEKRFDICRSFRCALLRSYQAGEIDGDQARSKVERAHELVVAVTASDPSAQLYKVRIDVREQLAREVESGTADTSAAQRLLNIVALDTFLDRWFRLKKKDQAESVETSDSNS